MVHFSINIMLLVKPMNYVNVSLHGINGIHSKYLYAVGCDQLSDLYKRTIRLPCDFVLFPTKILPTSLKKGVN